MKKEMLTIAKWLETGKDGSAMTQKEFDGLTPEEQAKAFNDVNENNVEFIKQLETEKADKEEMSKAIQEIQKESVAQNKQLMKTLQAIGTRVMEMSKAGSITAPVTFKSLISEKFDLIKNLSPNAGEVEIKAVFATTAISGNTDGTRDNNISELNIQRLTIADIYPTENITGSNNYIYTDFDDATITRGAAMVAEGGLFPESELGFIERSITMHKVGDSIPVNEEVFEDEARFANELDFFLRTNIAIKKNDQLLNGDNTGINLRGLITSGSTYVPVASGIQDANTWDVAQNMTLVMTNLGKKFMPTHLVMNQTEAYKMASKKDANNNYMTAPFVSPDGTKVGSMMIVIENGMANNEMIALDNRFGKILQKVGIQLSRGLVSDQFLKDQITLKVRERLNLLIKESNRPSVLYCTSISAAKTAIEV
jgi:hypothetical protein